MEKADSHWHGRALQVAAYVAAVIPVVGIGASWLLERKKNSVVSEKKKTVLADYYRDQVAAQLGMDPSKVKADDLQRAAEVNPIFAKAIDKVEAEKNDANRATNFMAVGAKAASTLVGGDLIPGTGVVALAAAHIAGTAAGVVASSMFDKDVLHTQDVMEHINTKRTSGQRVTAADIMMLRISADENLQAQMKKQNGTAFHKMTEAQQQAVAISMPALGDAAVLAERINTGLMSEQDVLMVNAASGKWATRVGGQRAPRGTFVNHVETQRAAAAQGIAAPAF
jgi:hypothetical protein